MGVKSLFQTLLFARLALGQDFQRLGRGDSISDVTEIDQVDDLLWAHVSDNPPDRLSERFCPKIPDSVDNSTKSEVDDTLLGADPAQLRVVDEMAPCLAPVLD